MKTLVFGEMSSAMILDSKKCPRSLNPFACRSGARLASAFEACHIRVTDPESQETRQNFGLRIVHRGLGMKQ
jgi:hypothetical protein